MKTKLLILLFLFGCGSTGQNSPKPQRNMTIDRGKPMTIESEKPNTVERKAPVTQAPEKVIDAATLVGKGSFRTGRTFYAPGSESPYTGKALYSHPNGKKHEEGYFKDGKRVGMWRAWYNTGSKWIERNYVDGKAEGPYVSFHKNGNKSQEGVNKAGKKSGKWTDWYESNGQIKKEQNYEAGKKVAPSISWYENGVKSYEGDGSMFGESKCWNEEGSDCECVWDDYGIVATCKK